MSVRILISEPLDFSPSAVTILSSVGEVELRACETNELQAALAEYDVVWIRLAHRIDRAALAGSLRCRVLACPATGLDHIDRDACAERGIRVVSLKGETEFLKTIRATAELTVGLTLALARQIPAATAAAREGRWQRDFLRGHELFGRTVGIVGMGRLGSIVAEYFRAFGMRVIGYDPRPDFPRQLAERRARLDDLLAEADLVSLHVVDDDSTHGLIGKKELALMKPTAMLVNTSRGGVIDETALLDALRDNRLAGAALDVVSGEPGVTAEHPLVAFARSDSRLLLTPHIGGNTVESFENTESFIAQRVVEALRAT